MEPKKGIATTELWVMVLTVLGSGLTVVQGMVSPDGAVYVVIGAIAAAVSYIASRTYVKAKASEIVEE